jgi:hypothetical protein
MMIRELLACLWLAAVASESAWSQVSIWTHRYDNARTGANLTETQLSTSTVNATQFGKLFSYAVDADIYTQPLVIAGVAIPGKGTHNVVYAATNNNSVYAFDADSNQRANGQPLWNVNLSGPAGMPVPASDLRTLNNVRTPGTIGIMGTPVIDQATGTMYLVARTKETVGGNTYYGQRLHALDIATGAEKFGGPVIIQASVPGSGYDSVAGVVTFNPLTQNQRVGLTLANGNVYVAWASHADTDPYHGWIMAYAASTLQQVGVYCVSPDGGRAGIWQSGQPLSVDGSGNLYVAIGNGDFDGTRNFGESIVKLSPDLSTLLDWFTPDNWMALNNTDMDLGSAGLLLIPGTNEVVGAGKEGRFYVLNRNNLGHTQVGNGQIVQSFQVTSGGNIHGAPTYWNGPSGPRVYVWGEQDRLKALAFDGVTFNSNPISQSANPAPPGMPGGFLTLSADGSQAGSGVLWASLPYAEDANVEVVSGVLRAFDAADLNHELWNTRMVPARDDLGDFAKFVPPTVANGRVYVASFSKRLHVYGLLASLSPPSGGAINGSGVLSTATVDLTAVGTSDWVSWPGYESNASGRQQISDIAFIGAAPGVYSNDPRTLVWTNGTSNACGSSANGVSVSGTSNGFLVTIPADTIVRTVKLYVGGTNSRGMLTAHLSDGSAADFVDMGLSSTGQYDAVYTLDYSAASAGQQLTIMWTLFSGGGSIALQGVALTGGSGNAATGCGVWVEDAVPSGATLVEDRENWEWVTGYPAPISGVLAHQSALLTGMHQHGFVGATATFAVGVGDTLFAYVYLDPANAPSEIMLQWNDGNWEHRAYWGADLIAGSGIDGTNSRRNMGALPAAGQWIRLEVPAALVGLEGRILNGMAYTLYDGRATWDIAGKSSGVGQTATTTSLASSANPSSVGASVTFTATITGTVPTGTVAFTDGGMAIANCGAVSLTGSGNSRIAACIAGGLSAGTHIIIAAYSGDVTNATSNSDPLSQNVAQPPPVLVSVSSRRLHGSAGTFDLLLSAAASNPTTEPRQGPAQTVVFTFDKPISSAAAAVTEGIAVAAAPTFIGSEVIVSLTGVANRQYVAVAVFNVTATDGGTGGAGGVRIGFIAGDVNQSRVVTLSDVGLVNALLAQPVTASNYLTDVNANGTLTVADKGITNAGLTTGLPAP